MPSRKYSDEQLVVAVAQNYSYAGVLRELGIPQAGGHFTSVKRRITQAGIDTSHFLGKGHGKGFRAKNRKTCEDILVVLPPGSARPKVAQLRRAMLESGVVQMCVGCGLADEWAGRPITLEVDHIDGNWLNNLLDNLRFLCPNCHSQETTNAPWRNL